MNKKNKKISDIKQKKAVQPVKAIQPAPVSVQSKPAAQPAPAKVQRPESKDVMSAKDREILSEVDRVIWNPSLLNKFKDRGKNQVPDGHDKKKLVK